MNRKFFPAIVGGAIGLALSIGVASAEPTTLTAVQMDGITGAGYDRGGGKQYCKKNWHRNYYRKDKGCYSCAPNTRANVGYSVNVKLRLASAGNIDL